MKIQTTEKYLFQSVVAFFIIFKLESYNDYFFFIPRRFINVLQTTGITDGKQSADKYKGNSVG